MTPADIDRVFGRGRLRMVTGDHVEVFREESQPGERRRYTKRFLATPAGDFRAVDRARVAHPRAPGRPRHRAGARRGPLRPRREPTGRRWCRPTTPASPSTTGRRCCRCSATARSARHVFEDCAHWWALARHSLVALDAIHELHLVHLDLKADNVCIPIGPADFDPDARDALALAGLRATSR